MGSTAIPTRRATGRRVAVANPAAPPRVKLDVVRVCLALLIVMGVSRIHQRYAVLSALRPGLLLIVVAVGASIANPRNLGNWAWTRRWQALVIAGIGVCTLGSIAFGISQGGAFFVFSDSFSKVLMSSFLLMAAIRNVRDLWIFVWAYVIGSAVLVWMALFVFDLTVGLNGVARLNNLETWDANDIGVLLLIGLGLGLLAFQTSGKKGKILAGIILLGIGAAIARSGSRGGFVGLAVVLLAYLLSMKGASVPRRVGLVAVLVIGVFVAAPANYWKQMNTIRTVDEDYNWDDAQGRRQLAIRGVGYMLSYPVFGLGIGNFGRAEAYVSDLGKQRADAGRGIRWSAAHNTYVQAGAELGIPGFLLFCGLVIGCIVAPWRLRRRIPSQWEKGDWDQRFMFQAARYFPIASLGFAVPAAFVSFAFLEPIYVLAAMTSALTASVHLRLRATPAAHQPRAVGAGWRSAK